jgi:hypothetical protein
MEYFSLIWDFIENLEFKETQGTGDPYTEKEEFKQNEIDSLK